MSFDSQGNEHDIESGGIQRPQRACDVCRRRKSRCEGSRLPGAKCSTCLQANLECTYKDSARKRMTQSRHVANLEKQLAQSEVLIRKLSAQIVGLREELESARSSESHDPSPTPSSSDDHGAKTEQPDVEQSGANATLYILRAALRKLSAPSSPQDPQEIELQERMKTLSIGSESHFVGKSSDATLINAVLSVKDPVRGPPSSAHRMTGAGSPWLHRRPQYWLFKPWKKEPGAELADAIIPHTYTFPPPDLASHLIDLYFSHAHVYLPVLHRQTFERSVKNKAHLWDNSFAAILLLVCAIGSRFSYDPRVLATSASDSISAGNLRCGWEWFNQVSPAGKHLFGQATLYDLQYYCLAVHFLLGASAPQASYMLVGVGLRLAQDAGAHHRRARAEQPSTESEQWKRAFWVLVWMDSYVASLMGRTCAIQYDDFDLDPPIECDDEFWEDPVHPFQQPPGVPSRIAFFNSILKLSQIQAFTLKILYSLNKARAILTVEDEWEEHFVAELDSALNRWREQIPEQLTWDPSRTDALFFDQSVALNCAYYRLLILVHRSFIPLIRNAAPTRLPSLTVCTNAARACAGMLDVQRQRKGQIPANFNMAVAFSSALVLVLSVWDGKRTGTMPDPRRDIENIRKCVEVIRLCEDRWQNAGILCDILAELASFDVLLSPLNQGRPMQIDGNAQAMDAQGFTILPQPQFMSNEYTDMLRSIFEQQPSQAGIYTPRVSEDTPYPYDFPQYVDPRDVRRPDDVRAEMHTSVSEHFMPSAAESDASGVAQMMAFLDNDIVSMWMKSSTG